jgi:hypothetical protein
MNIVLFIIFVLLFVLLTPGVLVSLPPKSSKLVTAITHGFIFAVILLLIHKFLGKVVKKTVSFMEGAQNIAPTKPKIAENVKETLVPDRRPQTTPNPVILDVRKIN